MSGPRPPPSSTSGPGPQASTGSSQQRTPSRTPSSPNRPRTDLLQPPSSPAAHTSTASGMSSNTPVRSSDLTRSQTSSTTNSPYATARSQHQSPYQPSIHSSSASFVSSTSGEEEDPSPSGHGARDARSASTSAAAPPPTSYAQAAARARQPSLTRLSSYAGGGQTTRQRSSSRARPANKRQQTSTGVSAAEDDEVRVLDRGEELIRRRNKERRAHAAALGRGQSYIDAVEGGRPGGLESRRVSRSKTPRDREPMVSQSLQVPSSPHVGTQRQSLGLEFSSSLREASREHSSVVGNGETDQSDVESVTGHPMGQSWEGSVRGGDADREEILEDEDLEDLEGEEGLDEGDFEGEHDDDDDDGDVELTLRDRQDAINIEHPFGLPIWKPALYKKSRTVTRQADSALHAIPSAAAQRHLLPGNLAWIILVGWWLSLICFLLAGILWCAEGFGRGRYATVVAGLGWYIGWPFGKYVEGEGLRGAKNEDGEALEHDDDSGNGSSSHPRDASDPSSDSDTVKGSPSFGAEACDRITPLPMTATDEEEEDEGSHATIRHSPTERDSLLQNPASRRVNITLPAQTATAKGKGRSTSGNGYGSLQSGAKHSSPSDNLLPGLPDRNTVWILVGRLIFWPLFLLVLAPIMLVICILCWGGVITIPMAKLLWALLKLLWSRPLELGFKPAPGVVLPDPNEDGNLDTAAYIKSERLRAGQVAPTGGPASTVLLCTYKAVGSQYYKYTVGGVNIMFVNLMPLVFFVIFDAFVFLPLSLHHDLGPFLNFIANRAVIFVLSLASVIPLSYFIGMAVASISAQSSIGMGAVINATFGSIIEIILYSIALTQGKGRLVEGSLVGSLLAGVLVMPGMSMLSGAFRRKEQSFNAKSAGVTSTMLIMAILGILTPTVFYQAYGSVELSCSGCPDGSPGDFPPNQPWMCQSCHYVHPDPAKDPFYQDRVKNLMYICASLLLLSYLIGLWFSLKTHASQIWQNPQQILQQPELITSANAVHPAHRASVYNRLTPASIAQTAKDLLPTHHHQPQLSSSSTARPQSPATPSFGRRGSANSVVAPLTSSVHSVGSASGHAAPPAGSLTPFVESIVRKDVKNMPPLDLNDPNNDYFAKAVTAATVTALRHQHVLNSTAAAKVRQAAPQVAPAGHAGAHHEGDGHGGGHEGPSWDRKTSASVLLACTFLYAIIAEILVDVVDVILEGSGIDEKFLGITLFALVPNTTEFMNAMSFALNGNIALSMEIGSAYALQVCLLQIPAMVAFSAIYDPSKMGEYVDTFTLILPQFDCISIMFSIFLLTYTYIEARANYHRGSILILAYLVLLAGFYYAPSQEANEQRWDGDSVSSNGLFSATSLSSVDPLPFGMNLAARLRGFFM